MYIAISKFNYNWSKQQSTASPQIVYVARTKKQIREHRRIKSEPYRFDIYKIVKEK